MHDRSLRPESHGLTYSREYPFPQAADGTTIHHITDTHFGAANGAGFVKNWLDRVRADDLFLDFMPLHGHVHTGDAIHWYEGDNSQSVAQAEADDFAAWRGRFEAYRNVPFLQAAGNHDLIGPGSYNSSTGKYDIRDNPITVQEFCTMQQVPSGNRYAVMGDIGVATISPDSWAFNTGFTVSAATLSWLDTTLQNAGRPVFIGAHVPLAGQAGSDITNDADVVAVLDANPNAVGWLSGHYHHAPNSTDWTAEVFYAGSRRMYGINGPGAAGGRPGGVAYADHQKDGLNASMYLTYDGSSLAVRWRNHNARQWMTPNGVQVKRLVA